MSVHADASRSNLYSIPEVTFGTTPGTPAFSFLRYTGTSIKLTKDTFQSGELHGDRMVRDHRHGTKQVGGDISIELSYGDRTDEILQAVLGGTWASDVLKAGNTRRSFSLLRHFGDLDSGDKPFHYFVGCVYNSLSLNFVPNGMVTGTVSVLGTNASLVTTAITGQSLGAASTAKAFDGFQGSVLEGGGASSIVTEATLNITNSFEPRFIIGDPLSVEYASGMLNVDGSITVYLANSALIEKFINETSSSLALNVADAAGNDYTFTVPNIVYNNADYDESGPGGIMVQLGFQGVYNSGTTTNIQVERS